MKRGREYKKKALEKAAILEKHTVDYASGIGFDIRYDVGRAKEKKDKANPI